MSFQNVIAVAFVFLLSQATVYGNSQITPQEKEVSQALKKSSVLLSKKSMNPQDVLALYRQEEIIGNYAIGFNMKSSEQELLGLQRSDMQIECAVYVKRHIDRFREVSDGWKGEDNTWEPNAFWPNYLKKQGYSGIDAREMEFDLAFKDFSRMYKFDNGAKQKSCRQYYEDIVNAEPLYLEIYTKEEIDSMPLSCEEQRKKFEKGREELQHRFSDVPAVDKLRKIDPTTVISDKYFGLC